MEETNATRQRSRRTESLSPSPTTTARNLPPVRRTKALRSDISLPLQHTRLRNLIYFLVFFTTLLTVFYSYRAVQNKRSVGGWWNLATGRHQAPTFKQTAGEWGGGSAGQHQASGESVEDKINALAAALGMPSHELASAIAVAVQNYVPPASLSSVAAKETGPAVKVLVEGGDNGEEYAGTAAESPGVVAGIVHGVEANIENFVGMEEP